MARWANLSLVTVNTRLAHDSGSRSAISTQAILAHPFITGLTDGTLPAESFAFYVVQDALYLQDYARALAAVGSRAPTSDAMQMFARHAADAVAAELELHATLLTELGNFCGRR